jgi:hypothetical protein
MGQAARTYGTSTYQPGTDAQTVRGRVGEAKEAGPNEKRKEFKRSEPNIHEGDFRAI